MLFFLLALCLMCFSKTRPLGVCIFGAVCCGALITNILLKDAVARPRPFETLAVYREWWQFIGSPAEDGFSFPSGHVTAAAAGMSAICFLRGKRWIWPCDGKPEAGVLGEPDEVTLWVEGDFRDFVEDDAGVVGVVCRPSGSVVAEKGVKATITYKGKH